MTDCVLPVTGGSPVGLVLLALLLLAVGVALLMSVRRGGFRGGAAVVLMLALGAALAVVDARSADAQECPPPSTVPPTTAAPAPTTTGGTTTTTASTTSTTVATTTTTPTGSVPTTPTTVATTTTATTIAAPDLTPTVEGPSEQEIGAVPGLYTIEITNVGSLPTIGQMNFTVNLPVLAGGGTIDLVSASSLDWLVVQLVPGDPVSIFAPTLVLGPGQVSTVSLRLDWTDSQSPGQFRVDVTLPPNIGGETNDANNTASLTVTVIPPPP
jgi:hypothetical protein